MRLKRIEAATVAEAMRRLREELGEQAVILHTKTLAGSGLDGLIRGPRVEILGAVDEPDTRAGTPALVLPAPPVEAPSAVAVPLPASAGEASRRADIAARLARFQAAVPTAPLATAGPVEAPSPASGPVRGRIGFAPSPWDRMADRARRIAFVGPTGAGKTTTLAKVAALAQLDHGRRVSLVTIDTYRIGAVPQLASYAEILGVPLHIAHTPEELAAALDASGDADLVYIDTTGRSPLGSGVDGLRPFLATAAPDDVCLVVSATTRPIDALRAAASYGRLSPNRLCVTKLDETDHHDTVPALAEGTGLPLTWLGTGQNVPDDLEQANPGRIAALAAAGGRAA
jgi:flagellar biosynthesis protein FlhF